MIYITGTIAINGNTVTGTGTNFSEPLSLIRVGCTLIAIGNPVQIFTITEIKSGTKLSVTPAANPAIPAGTKFSILLSDSISVDGLAQDVAETLRYYQSKETEIAAAVEWWNEFGGDGQMERLLADIRTETAKSTANAQKTESDKNAASASKTAAANSATAAKASQDAAKASETNAAKSAANAAKSAADAAKSAAEAAKSAADALNHLNQAQSIVGTDIGLRANRRDWPDCNDPTGYIGFCRTEESIAKNFPSIASGELYLVGWLARGDGATAREKLGLSKNNDLHAGRDSKFFARSFEAGVDKGWCQLATLNKANTWTNTNKFYGHYIVDSSYTRFIRHIPYASTTANAHIVTWGSSSVPLNYEVKAVDTSSSESALKTLFMAKYFSDGSASLAVEGAITCTTVNQSSDRDLKDNIQVIGDATEAIRKMNGYTYTLKENGLPYAGVTAQEVMEALPEAVGSFTRYGEELQGPTIDGNELREETRYLNVDYAAVTGLLVQVARETDNRVTELEEENASLRANIAAMDERIAKLEALVSQLTGSEK